MNFKLRDYQQQAFDKILTIYKNNPKDMRAVYQAPTGSGKTLTSLMIGIAHAKAQGYKHLLWVAHQKYLSEQPMDRAFDALGIQMTSDPNIGLIDDVYIHCITWQSARNKIDNTKYDMLIVDEVHQGSANQKTDHKTFQKLLQNKHFQSQLYVSATPWKLDKELFKGLMNKDGTFKSSRIVITQLQTLKDLGFICDVVFKSVQTEDTIKLKRIEDEKTEEVKGNTEVLADEIINKAVDVKDPMNVKILKTSVANSVLAAYFHEEATSIESIPPTLVFASSVDAEGDATSATNLQSNLRKRFLKRFGKVPDGFVQIAHSRLEDNDFEAAELLAKFQRDEFRVLIVCGMAKEGYDYPELEVVLDFRPSYDNMRQFMQKTGRLLRIAEGKSLGRYYIPDTVSLYIDQKGVKKDINAEVIEQFKEAALSVDAPFDDAIAAQTKNVLNLVGDMKTIEDPDGSPIMSGSIETKQIFEESEEKVDEESSLNFPKEPSKKVVTIVTAAYVVSNAFASQTNINAFMLFDGIQTKTGSYDTEGKKQTLINDWFKSGKKPSQLSKDPVEKRLCRSMTNYLRKSGSCFDPDFKALHDQYFPENSMTKKQILINDWFKSGKKPSRHSKDPVEKRLRTLMANYLSKSTHCFDPEFKALHDQYFPKKVK